MKKESRQKETLGRILKYMKKYWKMKTVLPFLQ